MTGANRFILASAVAILVSAGQVFAHHSFAAEYDANTRVTLTGTVTKVEWTNPHVRFYLDVKDERGTVANWELTMGSATGLMRRGGWSKTLLKAGDTVTVNGYLARDGSHLANARLVTLSDGRQMYTGAPPDSPVSQNER
jgi:uncharacterized protein DUF6152